MRSSLLVFILLESTTFATFVGPEGVDSLATGLDGKGGQIGQAEFGRSSKAGHDSDMLSSSDTEPTGVYIQNEGGMAGMDDFVDEHATYVAQQMIGMGLTSGVSQGADLHSLGLFSQNDDVIVALGVNRLARLNGGAIRAINISFAAIPGEFDSPNGNSHMTQFLDWSARRHDVLYAIGWPNPDVAFAFKPSDNYNGIVVAASAPVDGTFRKFSTAYNAVDFDTSDAQRIDILAPGELILIRKWDETFEEVNGSSFAAPALVGTVALLHQYIEQQINLPNPRFDSDARRHQVSKAVILNSADKITGVHGSTRTILDRMDRNWTQTSAYLLSSIALDSDMGAGHLNARKAVEQLTPGEYDPGMVPTVGWDYHVIGESGSRVEYIFGTPIGGGGYLAATLVWDRFVDGTELCGDDTYCEGDQFFSGTFENTASNLSLWLMPVGSDDLGDAVAQSMVTDDTIEHIFTDEFPMGDYKLVVTNDFLHERGLP